MMEEAHQRELREAELLLKIQIDDFAGEKIDPEDEPDLYLPLPAAKALHDALATTRAELAASKERERETLAVLQTAHESEAALVRQKNALIHVVRWISANYENGEINHKDFRVRAKHLADDALLGDPV